MSIPPITPASITTETLGQDITGKTEIAAAEHAARDPLLPPERHTADAAREPVRPPESAIHPVPPADSVAHPHMVAVFPVHSSKVVSADAFIKAEENLAAYLGSKLDPALTKDLLLTFSNILSDSADGRIGGTDFQLCFRGPMIEANFAEMQREVITALQDHPVVGKILHDNHTLMMDQVSSDEKGQMMHLHLPNLTPEQYAQLIHALATGHVVAQAGGQKVNPVGTVKDEASSAEVLAEVAAATQPTEPTIKEPKIKDPLDPKPAGQEIASGALEGVIPPVIELPQPPTVPTQPPATPPAPVVPVITAPTKQPGPISSIVGPATTMQTINPPALAQGVGA